MIPFSNNGNVINPILSNSFPNVMNPMVSNSNLNMNSISSFPQSNNMNPMGMMNFPPNMNNLNMNTMNNNNNNNMMNNQYMNANNNYMYNNMNMNNINNNMNSNNLNENLLINKFNNLDLNKYKETLYKEKTNYKVSEATKLILQNNEINRGKLVANMTAVSPTLQCSICLDLVMTPVECGNCSKLFCKNCIENWLKTANECPNKHPFVKKEELDEWIKKALGKIFLKCPYKDANLIITINIGLIM